MGRNEETEDQTRDSFNRQTSGDGDSNPDTDAPFPPGQSGETLNETTRRIAEQTDGDS